MTLTPYSLRAVADGGVGVSLHLLRLHISHDNLLLPPDRNSWFCLLLLLHQQDLQRCQNWLELDSGEFLLIVECFVVKSIVAMLFVHFFGNCRFAKKVKTVCDVFWGFGRKRAIIFIKVNIPALFFKVSCLYLYFLGNNMVKSNWPWLQLERLLFIFPGLIDLSFKIAWSVIFKKCEALRNTVCRHWQCL